MEAEVANPRSGTLNKWEVMSLFQYWTPAMLAPGLPAPVFAVLVMWQSVHLARDAFAEASGMP